MTYTSSSRCSSVASTYSPEIRKATVRRSVNKMLIAVVIAFFVCWAPFHAQRLLAVYVAPEDWTVGLRIANEVLYYAAGCFYYFSATINPILYTSMSSKYRGAFLSILTCHSKKRKASSNSLFRTTGNVCSETGHYDKEPSLRISKQSFDADSSATDPRSKRCSYSNSKNHLCVPDKIRCAILINDEHYRSKGEVNNMSFVRISPEGKLDDVLEQDGDAHNSQKCAKAVSTQNHKDSNTPRKSLVVSTSGKSNCVEDLAEFKNGRLSSNNHEDHKSTGETHV